MADRPTLDRFVVEHVARLASLALEPAELDSMATELARIVGYVEKLNELDTEGVPATSGGSPTAVTPFTRPDTPAPGLSHEEALAGAPRTEGGGFAVARFLENPKAPRG